MDSLELDLAPLSTIPSIFLERLLMSCSGLQLYINATGIYEIRCIYFINFYILSINMVAKFGQLILFEWRSIFALSFCNFLCKTYIYKHRTDIFFAEKCV